MYLPIFIAILMGLLSPVNLSSNKSTETIYVKLDGPISQNTTSAPDSIPPGDGGGDTGGENGHLPPPRP